MKLFFALSWYNKAYLAFFLERNSLEMMIYCLLSLGTLNPALQDRNGQPKRDITTIIHILNDLLCAQYKNYQFATTSRSSTTSSSATSSSSKTAHLGSCSAAAAAASSTHEAKMSSPNATGGVKFTKDLNHLSRTDQTGKIIRNTMTWVQK